jgi:hypothetical protein
MRKTMYAALGRVAWRVGKRYVRRRVRGARSLVTR